MAAFRRRGDRPEWWQDSCAVCHRDHALRHCERFLENTSRERYEIVERYQYCRNCLARSHRASNCKTKRGCLFCHRHHHTLLHGAPQIDKPIEPVRIFEPQRQILSSRPSTSRSSTSRSSTSTPSTLKCMDSKFSAVERHTPTPRISDFSLRVPSVFVPTAVVRLIDENPESYHSARVLLNPSLTCSRVAASLVRDLRLVHTEHDGVKSVQLKFVSRHGKQREMFTIQAELTQDLPRKPYKDPIQEDPTAIFPWDTIADVDPRCNNDILLELGSEIYNHIRWDGIVPTDVGQVQAMKTALGYVFSGPVTK